MCDEKKREGVPPQRGGAPSLFYTVLHEKHSNKGTAPKVSKGRRLASISKEKAEQVIRNERPWAATIEASDAARRRETPAFGKYYSSFSSSRRAASTAARASFA